MKISCELLIEDYAKELAKLMDQSDPNDLFEKGRHFGLAEAASLLLQQAKAFGAEIDDLGLEILSRRNDLL